MKILASSDWHVDAVTAGVERLPELNAFADQITARAYEIGADLILNLGDVFDPGSTFDPRWTEFVYRKFCDHNRAAARGLIAIPGNHDVIDTESPCSTLSGLRVASEVKVLEEPTCYAVTSKQESVAILALPYISRAYERSDRYRKSLDDAFEASLRAARHSPLIVITHLALEGMTPGSEHEMGRGREVPFPIAEVEQLSPNLVLAGHYHARETVRRGSLDIHIIGAPIRFTFGELDEKPRGFLELEVA